MLEDARRTPRDSLLDFDLCIIGAGPVGIVLARRLAQARVKVCLLESGGFEPDPTTQRLYDGRTEGTVQLDPGYCRTSRVRYFGGSTNHWTGMCRAMDDIDFEKRPWIPNSGWPFPRSVLLPYYAPAAELCELAPQYPDDWGVDSHPGAGDFLCEPGSSVRNIIMYMSPPTRFGRRYRDDVVDSPHVSLFLEANVTDITANASGSAVESLLVRTLSGNRFRVRARIYVLAAGGLESPRLLLASDGVQKNGLGNDNDLVGRYFMEHPHIRCGFMCFLPDTLEAVPIPSQAWDRLMGQSPTTLGLLSISQEEQRRSRLLNLCAEAYGLSRDRITPFMRAVASTSRRLDRATAGADFAPYYALLFARAEQAPNPDSRVLLGEERDALGMRRVVLDWRLRDEDRHSIYRSIELIGNYLGQHRWGRAAVDEDLWDSWLQAGGGAHHMGTTRMDDDPKHGVVDVNGRVHSVANLFVGGSSVYPATGFANPLLTTLALTLRLGDHLEQQLAGH